MVGGRGQRAEPWVTELLADQQLRRNPSGGRSEPSAIGKVPKKRGWEGFREEGMGSGSHVFS